MQILIKIQHLNATQVLQPPNTGLWYFCLLVQNLTDWALDVLVALWRMNAGNKKEVKASIQRNQSLQRACFLASAFDLRLGVEVYTSCV